MKRLLLPVGLVVSLAIAVIMGVFVYNVLKFTRPVEVLPLTTPWTSHVDPEAPLSDYPRPQLRRDNWQNLNGRWNYAIAKRSDDRPEVFAGEIVVPFAIESSLSGVEIPLLPDQRLWYQTVFSEPQLDQSQRLLLHFGAVDWEAEVWLNGKHLGIHRGGYTPFTFDITDALEPAGSQELVVAVWDPTNLGPGAYGKQHLVPHGIRYTAVSGIWQTVWTEVVPVSRINSLVGNADLASGEIELNVETVDAQPLDTVEATLLSGDKVVGSARGAVEQGHVVLHIAPQTLRVWSPADPFLYDLQLKLLRGEQVIDRVESYHGAREVAIVEDSKGVARLYLNGEPLFHLGLLDQGWWPDGLYTAPTDEALVFDIEATRRMGFNTIRKHVKVEPARWYWHADRLGLMVWQDMPTGEGGGERYEQFYRQARDILSANTTGKPSRPLQRSAESAELFRAELFEMMDHLAFFPSIVSWVPFNEAWGQFNTDSILAEVGARDPHRLVDGASGWFDTGTGDMLDLHMYAREADFVESLPSNRALVYGEFGGLGLPLPGHLAVEDGWGYSAYENAAEYDAAYMALLSVIEELIPRGLAGAIYTQTTDVESEINGLITYDRRAFKIPPEKLADKNRQLVSP